MSRLKTQSKLVVNAKLESINTLAVATDGQTTFAEGTPFRLDSTTGRAAAASTTQSTAQVVFINWVPSTRSDVEFRQGDYTDTTAPTLSVRGGGLTGIIGSGVEVGLLPEAWEAAALPTVGQFVQIATTGTPPKFTAATTPSSGEYYYGIVTRIDQGRAFFVFNSNPMKY